MGINLDTRLSAAAQLVQGTYLCDVGSDHAYLPCALALAGKIKGGMAMDVNAGPLENAARTIRDNHMTGVIETCLSDGLDELPEELREKITDISICGMGGELIDAIVSRAAWLKNDKKCLILQPMTQIPYLRRRLYEQGFAIEREIPVVDKHHLYTVMAVRYTGECIEIDELFAQVGKIPESGHAQAADYLQIVSGRVKKAGMGMLKSADKKEQGQEMLVLAEKILGSSLKSASGVTVGDVYAMLDAWAPFASQCGWDHSGLQTGSMEKEITGVVVALDCTDEVIDYAVASGANLILTHHPLIFDPLFAVTDDMPAAKLVKNGIALICAHTNLDLADGGVTDCLAQELELSDCVPFGEDHAGRIGMPEHSMTAEELVGYVKRRLKCNLLYWEGDRPVRRIAVVGGAGSEFAWDAAAAGADAYITGELKHNYFMDLSGTGMTLIAAGHYATERVVLPAVKARLQKKFPGIPVQIFELTRMKSC